MTLSRRAILKSTAGIGASLAFSACSQNETIDAARISHRGVALGSSAKLPLTLLVNRERAADVMMKAGVAAIICSVPRNIYYTTNYYPILSKMGMEGYAFAILPADPKQAPVLVEGEFAFYIAGTESVTAKSVDLRLFTAPIDSSGLPPDVLGQIKAKAFTSFMPIKHDTHALSAHEANKRKVIKAVSNETFVNSHAALVKAVLDMGLETKRLTVDNPFTRSVLARANILDVSSNGENMLRTIRLQKSSAEIELMRYAANANAESGLMAAKLVREGASFVDLRRGFFNQCTDRLLTPDFMVIDGVAEQMAHVEIKDGRAFLIDCVSNHQHYHGDYGRTVCVGEPTKDLAIATKALSDVWDDLLPRIKPGVKYNEIREWATSIHSKTDSQSQLFCNPHSVGLQHTDEPSANEDGYFVKDNLELVEGMIISVDLPMMEVGLGGSAHLEDLVLITSEGAELLNNSGNRMIIV